MGRVAHLLVASYFLVFCQAKGFFPDSRDFAKQSTITSSSTCGQTESQYCDPKTLGAVTCTKKVCKTACCTTCTDSSPTSHDLTDGRSRLIEIATGNPRPGTTQNSFGFDAQKGSYITIGRLPTFQYKTEGFTICVWVNQTMGNEGTIFSKSPPATSTVIYGIVLQDFTVTLYYMPDGSNVTESINVTPLASQYPRDPEGWHFICVMVIDIEFSYFLDGTYVGTVVSLKNTITDAAGRARIGQMFSGAQQYDGLMQNINFFSKALTNREVTEMYTGRFPTTYIASECRCPPSHPKISTSLPGRKCAKNSDKLQSNLVNRLSETAHPIEFATDGDSYSYWLSTDTDNVTINIDLMYGPLQVFHIVNKFYGPQPAAILIERSINYGESYQPWQYYAVDCQEWFGMANNGPLSQPDSVNCIQLISTEYDNAAVSFNPEPGTKLIPSRPYGGSCDDLSCSKKLLDFMQASNVRLSFYNHTLSPAATYFGLYKLIVTGTCECFGNAKTARYIPRNGTNNGTCVCECHPSTFTEGQKCERCQPLYNNKPFLRSRISTLYPCLKCECHDHATSCYYNQTLDPFPRDRTRGGGGVCISCQHNTAGQHCESCEEGYYRETGKDLDDADVCTPCGCTGPGVKPGKQDCVKDDSDAAILAGQCECKDNVTGRLCTQCKAGYYDLKSSHATGCITCGCDVRGTVNGDNTCDVTTGQCRCKANVTGRQCDQCKAMFYNLTSGNSEGCQPCLCNMTGATSLVCDTTSGQCPCRNTVRGRQCERCDLGFHTLTTSGCQVCQCSVQGTRSGALTRCDPVSGSCQCKNYVTGYRCDRCKLGYYNLQRLNDNGCSRCRCDTRGTLANSRECHGLTGACTCKMNVTGQFCDQCPRGFYNLSSSNVFGCQPCRCHAKGTVEGDTKRPEDLNCGSSTGGCLCLSNVRGMKCDQCDVGYVWNQAGAGCISCRCDPDGSVSRTCNDTGYCSCRTGTGVGGQFCDRCLTGYHSFTAGRCTPCNCDRAGVTRDGCDIAGCFHCKQNVQGTRCDRCKTGTRNLKEENPFGCSGVPSQQGPPIVHTLSSTILHATWDPPDQPNGLITNYELYRNSTRVYNGLLREFNDTRLRPYTLYEYYVITHTDGGNIRSFDDGKLYRTAQDAPSGVSRPNITDIRPRTAKAVWSNPTTRNGILTSFFLESNNPRDTSTIEHCRGLVLSCDVINLRPYTVYNFTVRVCTNAGCSKSQARRVLTRPTAPDSQPAPDVVPLPGGKSFSVSWDEPAEPNGVIFRYELHQRLFPAQQDDHGRLVYSSSPSANPGADNLRNTTVTELVPFTWYEYRVETYTAEVSGDTTSNWTRRRTAEAVPEGENEINPQSHAVSSSEVNITWSIPASPHGIIIRSRVYIYTNETSYSTPVLARTVNGSSTAVVSGLQPYTIYKFTVTSCNSVGCTKHSAGSETRTLPSAPSGQLPPTGKPLNSTHVSLTWNPPAQPNGPVPPKYHVTRSHAAFHSPSINTIDGAHFPGLGYYLLSDTAIPEGIETQVEFWFRTRSEHGLIMFLTSDTQDDFMAVEIRHGAPWLIFDLQEGIADISVLNSRKFNDGNWHFVEILRSRRNGRITLDKKYEGRGQSPDGATYIDKNTGVYIGGVKPGLSLKRNILDSVYSLNYSISFIGCLRDLRLHNRLVSLENALEKVNVEPLTSGCPEEHAKGFYLRGGGYLSLKKNLFRGPKIYTLSFDFRTFYTSGMLVFVYGERAGVESYLTVCLDSGDIRVLYRTKNGNGSVIVVPDTSVCDGHWHSISLTNFANSVFTVSIDDKSLTRGPIANLDVTSELYFGGLPFGSRAAQKARSIGLTTGTTFGGCFRNIVTNRKVNLLTDVGSIMNVDLSGCPRNVNGTRTDSCNNGTTELVYGGTEHSMVDGELTSFTDYLYRVESKQPGTEGGGKSSWFVLRSGEGAPEFYRSPYDVIPQDGGQSTRVAWKPPQVYHGVLRGYIVRAYHVGNSSVHPVEMTINEISVFNTTLSGLEPFTWYDVRVAAFTNGGTGESPGTRVRTLESVPEGVRTPDVQRYPHSLLISWQVPVKPNGIITNYSLTVNNTEVYRGLNLTFNLTGLGVFTRHVIQLTACTEEGCTQGAPAVFYTAEILPQGVTPPDVRILGAHRAEVTWQEPGTVNGIILRYQVLVNAIGSPSWETIVRNATANQRLMMITNLTAGTWFAFRLKAINGGGATLSSPTRRRTVESSPEDIPPPVIRGLTPYSILVTILEPGLPNGNITRYELYKVIGRDELIVFNETTRQNYTQTGLTPYSQHYFRSRVCTAKGCGSSAVGCGRSLEASPNGTVRLNISIVNSTSVLGEWSPVHTPNGVVYYNLVVRGEFFVQGTANFQTENDTRVVARAVHPTQEILFTQLLPYTSFEFQINASNTAGFVLSNIVQGRTGQGAPIGLAAPNVTILNSTSAHVTWRPPARDNGVLLSYDVRRTNVETGVTKVVNATLDLSLLMTDMEPYIKYQFQVGASTSGGKTWSDATEMRTLQDVPTPLDPPTISQVNSRSLGVNWDRATKPNGVIIHYILYRNVTHRTTAPSNVTKLTVSGLEPFTIYVFSIASCTVIGCSNSSLSRPIRTLEDVPQGQSPPVLSQAPGPSVLIRWSVPTLTNGKISEYKIERKSELDLSNMSSVARIAANLSTEHVDNTVKPCTKYFYRVIAFTKAGGGTPSPWSNITTQEGAPDFVPRPTTRVLNSSAVHVTWFRASSQCTVTRYIVRVVENNRNYSGFEADDPRGFIISGLLPYKVYNIVIAGCTASSCRDSAPSVIRTHSGLPSNQPAPSARPLDSTSLRVTWEAPAVPGGVIREFILHRRTLDEPLAQNFTITSYERIYTGTAHSFDDRGLGIFSEQQYKVTIVNRHGNTTSPDSLPFRTGPAPPRAGVLLRGQAVNHTSVLLNWTVPEVKLLLGYIRSYEVRYKDIQEDIEYTFMNNLVGSARNVVVSPLTPSKDYAFQVILNNGAGTKSSNEVTVRTLDGAPEGFDTPSARTINSTTIEVTWSPPRTPNGRITTYNVYANSQRVGSTSSLYLNVTSLIPFTHYDILVEVCTVYTCVRSASTSARTLPAVPEFLDSPTLFPGRRNVLVTWDPPRRPNGVIGEYILYRRTLKTCPTRPPPVKLCTYIECPLAEQLCGTSCYNPGTKTCCNGVLYNKDLTKTCCDDQYLRKPSTSDVCCGGRFHTLSTNYQCCHGDYKLVQPGQVCCQSSRGGVHVGGGNACCDGTPYSNNTKYCVCGAIYDDPFRKCCGGQVVAVAQKCCGGSESDGRAYNEDPGKKCCGSDYVPVSSLCCQSNTGIWKIYNYASTAERQASGDTCCGNNRISAGLSCCNDRGFNASLEICADKDGLRTSGCGNGTVCDISSRNTALCNRCDFDRNTLYCGYTRGYYTPVPPTPPSQDCDTFQQVVSGNASLRRHSDQGLEPFTDYEYYLVVYNTEGNVSSPYIINKTLMDAPEGLAAPDVTVLSARSINITFKPPSKPNGIISQYKLTRVNSNSTSKTLVYQGLDLSYLDTGVRPFTEFSYILEVCTTLCSNISSQGNHYTREATPEDIYPPMLKALSAYSIEVRWQEPGRPNGVITGYNISRVNNTGHIIMQWQGHNLILLDNSSDIRPYTNYTYIVTACTKIGCSSGSRGFVTTLEAPPEGVWAPVLQRRSARAIEVNWNEPAIPNGRIIWYALYRDNILIYNTSGEYRRNDTGLNPHTLYSYVIEASTSAGSTRSNESRTRTPQDSPEGIPPPTLIPQSSSSMLVTWTAPSHPNGVITNYSVIQDTVVEQAAGTGTRLSVSGLEPFTEYSFQIKACTVRGCGVGNRGHAKTLEAPPIGQPAPSLVALSDAVVRVTWRGPQVPNGIILSYEVERSLLSSVPVVVFKTTPQNGRRWETLNSGLLPYRVYKYRIRAINSAGSNRSLWATVRTGEGAPSGIYPPIIHVINATAVTASWQEPRVPNGHITRYELWTREIDNHGNRVLVASSSTPEQNVTVSGLRPSTNYEFRVSAETVGGTGYSQWTLAETLEAPPLGLRPLTARKHSSGRDLTLTWDEPAQPNGVIIDYVVYSEGVKVYSDVSRRFSLGRLQPFTSYTFQLEACTSAGCTKGRTQVITTAEIPPDLLQAPVFSAINSTYVTLEWQAPALPNGIIILYQVFREGSQFAVYNSSHGNVTSYTDSQLEPYTKYVYKIRAENSAGDTESRAAPVTTRQAAPEFVHPPVVKSVTSTYVDISWSPPGKPNGVVTSYTLRRNGSVINHWGYRVLKYVDHSVSPDTFYGYWLSVCTGGGCTHSDKNFVKSGESRPDAVRAPRLTVLSAIAIRVEWQPPVISNGIVRHYELYMDGQLQYNGSNMFYVTSNLRPYTSYTFHVRACTKTGCTAGPSSEAKTHEDVPKELDMPTYTIFGPSILEIRWAFPRQPNGVILYYTLRRNSSLVYNGSDLSYKDQNVEPFTYYSYVVTAANSAGYVSSPVLYTERTSPGTPENVTKPRLTPLSGKQIEVVWSAPVKPNGIITEYLVLYNNIQINVGSNMSFIARDLDFYTVYTFRIRACTSYPSCADSSVASTRTLEGIPRGQPAPNIQDKTVEARSVVVAWGQPRYPNGVILKYIVYRTPDVDETATEVFSGLTFNFTDTTVVPYQKYEYRVTAVNSAGLVTSGWTSVTTRSAPPEQVSTPRILAITETSLVVAFDPPGTPNGMVINYKVRLNNKSVSEGTHLKRTLRDLQPFQDYTLRVVACTVAGCTSSQAISIKTDTGRPGKVEEPTFGEVTANSIEVNWQPPVTPNGDIERYFVLYKFICSENCISKRAVTETKVNVGLNTSYVITDLEPYSIYEIVIRILNEKYSTDSTPVRRRTGASDPKYVRLPIWNTTGDIVVIDWSKSFKLNGPLLEYVLYENDFLIFRGTSSNSGQLPGRAEAEYIYVISLTTSVNGEQRTIKSVPFNINNSGGVSGQSSDASETWYKTIWFLVLISVLLILAVFGVVALCLRRTSGDRTVYVRERDPVPVRPKSRSTAGSSNYTPSEAHFNLGMVDYNHDTQSRVSTFIGESEKTKYDLDGSLGWEGYEGNGSYAYNEKYDDDKTWADNDEVDAFRSTKYHVFTDTRL